MAAPVITSIVSVAQGTGAPNPLESVIDIRVTFTGPTSNLEVELSIDGGSTWHQTVKHSAANGESVTPGTGVKVLVAVQPTFELNALSGGGTGSLTPYYGTTTKVRVRGVNVATSEASGYTTSANFTLKSKRPVVNSVVVADYVGSVPAATPITINASDVNISNSAITPTQFRSSLTVGDLQPGGSASFNSYGGTQTLNTTFNFGAEPEGPNKTIYVRAYDQFYNASELASDVTYLRRTAPENVLVRLTGSSGSDKYTGIKIETDGSFTPDRSVRMQISANSPIPMQFRIESSSDLEATTSGGSPTVNTALGTYLNYTAANLIQTGKVTTNKGNPTTNNYNTDQTVTISIRVTDAAGNTTTASRQIRLNTRIYKTAQKPMWPSDTTYQPILKYLSTGNAEVVIPRTMIIANAVTRAWADIHYPATHGYPVNPLTGDIDEDFVLADSNLVAEQSTAEYDAVQIIDIGGGVKKVKRDTDGRPIVASWTTDGSKNYTNLESSNTANLRYWVIDNTKYGDFQLTFERFDLDDGAFGPPYNPLAPYRGDVLVIYDADDPAALELAVDNNGNEYLALADPTALREIMSFAGNGPNVVNKTTGSRMNSGQNGEFTTEFIRNTKKICIVLYSDVSANKSGFKVKSGPSHQQIWVNYDLDEKNGEIWIHMHESIANTAVSGASETTSKRLQYDYMDQSVTVDHETATVTFSSPQTGVVTMDATYLGSSDPGVDTWTVTHDDFLAYNDVAIYVMPAGQSVITSSIKDAIYEIDGYGRMMQHHSWDKDRGVVTFDTGHRPVGRRMYASYYHHTFLRITNDGYGDLTWHDSVLVADDTPVYPDYTWKDVKISNEGDALLEDMKVKFVARGYDTNNDGQVILDAPVVNVVDQVLDINRPWDIQRGTREETYQRMAMGINAHYIWNRTCPKFGGDGNTGDSGATTILAAWADRTYGDISARSVAFGRAVWVLGSTSGSSYPTTSAGGKRCSFEATGKYYSVLII